MQGRKKLIWGYVIADYVAAAMAWLTLYFFRKMYIEQVAFNSEIASTDTTLLLGFFAIPAVWLLLYYVTGCYTDIYRKSRLIEMLKTFFISMAGVTVIFFALLLDDDIQRYSDYYLTLAIIFSAQLSYTVMGRLLVLFYAKAQLQRGTVGFNTLIIGSDQKANEIYEELSGGGLVLGYRFCGYLELGSNQKNLLTDSIRKLGSLEDLEAAVEQYKVEEVIVAVESTEHHRLNYIINTLAGKEIYIKIIPDLFDILSGTVKFNHIISTAFIEIPPVLLSEWQRISKRWFDVALSLVALLFLGLPMLLVAAIIKLSSKGPVFYEQERLGQYGIPFRIIKFRSMYTDAEKMGPQLASAEDKRITPIGRFMRKYRVDELPQFINILRGDMSLIGPRAERRYYVDQILPQAPYYKHVWKVKPGLTSLGMVKYGYASTVDEMVKRLKYDILYIENMSILLDMKIIIYTVMTVLYGRGK
jgi:exopolysaccharide biosynthesis polyprenyl glycosylphosphotransferase